MLKKLSVLVLTFAVAAVFAPGLNAQSISEAELRAAGLTDAEVALFMSLLGGTTTTTTTTSSNRGCDADYLRDLSMGSQGADVMNLQEFLNDAGFTVSVSGAGSVGMESMYFGAKTKAAVTAFQNAYAADILTPVGLTSGTGYFGAGSRAKVRDLCMNVVVTPDDNDNDNDDNDDNDDDTSSLRGGEASLESFEMNDGETDEIEEGKSEEVAEITFDVEDGDVRVSRLDLSFEAANANDEDEPWDVFSTVTLLDEDGDEIASEDVSDEDDWLENDDEPFVFRFKNLDYVVREGDEAMITVVIEAEDNLDGLADGETWTIFVDEDDIRAEDSEGIQQYTGDEDETVTFDLDEAGADAELTVRESDSNPEGSIIQVDDDNRSDFYAVVIADFESEDEGIEFNTVSVVVETGDAFNDVVNDARLVMDGEEFDDYDTYFADTDGTRLVDADADGDFSDEANYDANRRVLEFDIDGDYTLDADEEVEVSLELRFNADNGYAPSTVEADFTSELVDDIDAEASGEDLDAGQLKGSVDGEVHDLLVSGAAVEVTDTDVSEQFGTTNASNAAAQRTFTIMFDVTAFDQDVYVPNSASDEDNVDLGAAGASAEDTTASTTAGAYYNILNSDTDDNVHTDVSSNLSSTAKKTKNRYRVSEGDTESFTLKVTVDPSTAGYYALELAAVGFYNGPTTVAGADYDTNELPDDEDYQTEDAYINN